MLLLYFFLPEIKELPLTREDIESQLKDLGRPTREEIGTIIVFSLFIFLWMFNPIIEKFSQGRLSFPIGLVSILGGIMLFLLPFRVCCWDIGWDKAAQKISWDSIILIMASLGQGMMV